MHIKTKQELQNRIAAYDIALYALNRVKNKPPALLLEIAKLGSILHREQKKLIQRFENYGN